MVVVITKCDDMDDLDRDVSTLAVQNCKDLEAAMGRWSSIKLLSPYGPLLVLWNKYIDETMPWVLAKSEDAHDKARLQSLCITWRGIAYHCYLVSPVIPVGAQNPGTIRSYRF